MNFPWKKKAPSPSAERPISVAAAASWDQALADARVRERWDPKLAAFTELMEGAGFDESRLGDGDL